MKTKLTLIKGAALLVLLSTLHLQLATVFAQGTAFTYQGRLNDGASPANGIYDLQFTIYDSTNNPGTVIGGPLTNAATGVTNGLFTMTLDFGAGIFTGPDRWLEIEVRTNGAGAFARLSPRQKLTATPYAITAGSVTGAVPSGNLAGTYSNAVTFNNSANSFNGSFSGNGGGLSNVNALTLGGFLSSSFWQLGGNNVAPGQFLGSTNDQPVEIKVSGQRALRLEPNTNGAPNVIGGSQLNQVDPGIIGATIGGGGAVNSFGVSYSNRISESFGTIGGGGNNTIEGQSYSAVIGGGFQNSIQFGSYDSVIVGGSGHLIQHDAPGSTILGGYSNTNGAPYSIIGGLYNTIGANSSFSLIGSGYLNAIQTNSSFSVIAGGEQNTIAANSGLSAIGGGLFNSIQAGSDQSVVVGGNSDVIEGAARESFIGGGYANRIQSGAAFSFIGAGTGNLIGSNSIWGTIAGGQDNAIEFGAQHATIGGGTANTNRGGGAFIGGGILNRAENFDAVVGGGGANVNSGYRAFIGSGEWNVISNAASYTAIGAGRSNMSASAYGVIGGGFGNSISNNSTHATIGGGFQNVVTNNYATVGGGYQNLASGNFNGSGDSATVGGGYQNAAVGNNAVVAGGVQNVARGDNSAITGGWLNTNQTGFGFIGGGQQNFIEVFSRFSVVSGGDHNTVRSNSTYTVISGGQSNRIGTNATFAAILGGHSNEVTAAYGLASGRRAKANHQGAFVWADSTDADFASTTSNQFNIRAMGGVRLETSTGSATLNGQAILSGTVPGNSLAGTYSNAVTFNNAANSFTGNGAGLTGLNAATLEGLDSSGFWKTTGNGGTATGVNFLGTTDTAPLEIHVDGTRALRIEPGTNYVPAFPPIPNIVGGSPGNFVVPTSVGNVIAGGGEYAESSTNYISGYNFNSIGGGWDNHITNGYHNVIAGGEYNTIGAFEAAVLGGGKQNIVTGDFGAIGGGQANTSGGYAATVPGGQLNAARGDYGFAAGRRAKANHPGAFVWADSTDADFVSTADNQFLVRAGGGVRVSGTLAVTNNQFAGGITLYNGGNPTAFYIRDGTGERAALAFADGPGAYSASAAAGDIILRCTTATNRVLLQSGGGSAALVISTNNYVGIGTTNPTNKLHVAGGVSATAFVNTSDRNAKENFKPISAREILAKVAALPITTWNFKEMKDGEHLGPVAQDFYAAFNLGGSDKTITTTDEGGVALAAIQGLNQKLTDELKRRDAENAELKRRLEALEKVMLNQKSN